MSKLIATDLDGTLFYPKHRVKLLSKKTKTFLRNHYDNGGKIAVVSGRNSFIHHKIVKAIKRPVDFIGCNGSFVIADDKKIIEKSFSNINIKDILKDLEDEFSPGTVILMSKDENIVSKSTNQSFWFMMMYYVWYFLEGIYRDPYKISDHIFNHELENGSVYKIMLFFGLSKKNRRKACEANKKIREKYGNVVEASWSHTTIELTPYNCNKANGIELYANYFGIKNEDIYVVGDSGNDISMFNKFHENSYCIAKAPLSVSKYAKHVIKKFHDLEKYISLDTRKGV